MLTGRPSSVAATRPRHASSIPTPLKLVLANLSADITLTNAQGALYGQPFVRLPALAAGSSASVTVIFSNPKRKTISYQAQAWNGGV